MSGASECPSLQHKCPAGVTRDAAIEALWSGLDPDRGVAWFKAVLGNLRRALRPSEPSDVSPIPRVVDRYQANPT